MPSAYQHHHHDVDAGGDHQEDDGDSGVDHQVDVGVDHHGDDGHRDDMDKEDNGGDCGSIRSVHGGDAVTTDNGLCRWNVGGATGAAETFWTGAAAGADA